MFLQWNRFFSRYCLALLAGTSILIAGVELHAQVTPGTGTRVDGCWDDFEDESWEFITNLPKSSTNVDKQTRYPLGQSTNSIWTESAKRGQPDVIQRIPTPAGGLPGSKGALLLKTLHTGVPGQGSRGSNQDDLIMQGSMISVSYSPSVVTRVYIPPFEEWEDKTGTSFGFRAAVKAPMKSKRSRSKRRFFSRSSGYSTKIETIYLGMFIQFNSKTDSPNGEDSAMFVVRADTMGQDFIGPEIKQTGWWTLGMSFTPDGRTHYYASPGVDPLTPADRFASHLPYGTRIQSFHTAFFNVCNQDNGRTWSTEWIIDDPGMYYIGR
ncbi:hypothetical protein [Gimesia aquarii]|uniref:Secreted protein n=1 Tax=Gimesia aquarii TaxID=2527964 RepID=A0A517WRJ0_9PLAN|nr:hypothetical protein [Gimesia aquarii]QDU07866.1 hypothetical protein V202x_12270 [Gimesia aquarii]